jgi:Flavin containing amine oxidoreductase
MGKHIIIVGGGISGLTIAHELLDKKYDVTLIEKDSSLGGMAKSRREVNGIPSEHSWRGYAPFYKNTFELLRKIPIPQENKTVYDNLAIPIDFYLMKDKIDSYKAGLNNLDYVIAGYYGLKFLLSNDRKEEYYQTKLLPLLGDKLSADGHDNLIEFIIGPGLGMEKKDVSYGHLFRVVTLQMLNQEEYEHKHDDPDAGEYRHRAKEAWHVMNQPTNEAWFDPWKRHLISKGLKLRLNTEVVKFNLDQNKITSCVINNGSDDLIIKADDYVVSTNPYAAENIFANSKMDELKKKHELLNKNTSSNQISFRLGFDKKIKFPKKNIAFVMVDSEFNITMYPQESHWKKGTKLDNDGTIKSLWSGTIIQAYNESKMYNKKAIELTKDELINDITRQILRSKSFQKLIRDSNGFNLTKDDIIYSEIWYEWEHNGKELEQSNKKWVNNVYNEQYRTKQRTDYDNLYIAGAHTDTSMNIWSMEGAVESGKIVAKLITDSDDSIELHNHVDPTYVRFFQTIDDALYAVYLPNIVDTFIILLIILVTVVIWRTIQKE